jgi:hypothetical protein
MKFTGTFRDLVDRSELEYEFQADNFTDAAREAKLLAVGLGDTCYCSQLRRGELHPCAEQPTPPPCSQLPLAL